MSERSGRRRAGSRREPPGRGASRPAERPRAATLPDRGRVASPWLPAALVGFAAVLLYLPTLGYGFVWDDHSLIVHNPGLRTPGGVLRLLGQDFWHARGVDSGMWRPLVVLSYGLDGAVSGFQPGWFHAVNVLLHACTAALMVLLILQLGASSFAAAMAGLWFAAAPAHVEPVAWISGRTDLLCAAPALLALLLDRRARVRGNRWPGPWALALAGLAMLGKEAALPLALVVLGLERARGASARAASAWAWPYLAVAAIVVGARFALIGPPAPNPELAGPGLAAARWAAIGITSWFAAFQLPGFPQGPGAPVPLPRSPWEPWVLIGAALQLLLVAAIVVAWRRRWRALPALLLVWAPLLPVLANLFVYGRGHLGARLTYLSSAGLAWLVALALDALARRPGLRRVPLVGGSALALASVAGTLATLPVWKDDTVRVEWMMRHRPEDVRSIAARADQLAEQGRYDEALRLADEAERRDPSEPAPALVRAGIAFRRGDWNGAAAQAEQALARDPMLPQASLLRADALLRAGRIDAAGAALAAARARHPDHRGIVPLEGRWLLAADRVAEAVPVLERALREAPEDLAVPLALGSAYARSERYADARRMFEQVLARDPGNYGALLGLAGVCHRLGDRECREGALARAQAAPGARDGRAAALAEALRRDSR